jgi:thiol-disulfide isomerase/thioredoxin
MDWPIALIAGLGLLAVSTAIGIAWKASTGRVRASGAEAPGVAAALDLDTDALGDRATLVQFSTEYCSGCRPTARQLSAVAGDYDGVRHVEIDLTHRADLAARFAVLQTPTTLILGADGALTARIGGVPRTAAVRRHLDTLTGRPHVSH